MEGVICKRDILAHPIVTIRSFGWKVFCRALLAGPRKTFLSLLMDAGSLRPATSELSTLIHRCVTCELRAMRVYQTLAERFAAPPPVHELFATLARHEQEHADLLEVCRREAMREAANNNLDSWQAAVPRVEQRLDEVETSLDSVCQIDEALHVVLRIESSEINRVFSGVVAGSESGFVRALNVFRVTGERHIAHISKCLTDLQPSLKTACQQLVA